MSDVKEVEEKIGKWTELWFGHRRVRLNWEPSGPELADWTPKHYRCRWHIEHQNGRTVGGDEYPWGETEYATSPNEDRDRLQTLGYDAAVACSDDGSQSAVVWFEPPTDARGRFHDLVWVPRWANDLVAEAELAGVFTTGIASDRRQRGTAVNSDVYGHDEARGLVVVQVRECQFGGRYGKQVRKDYFLIGHGEDGVVWAHPVESPVRSRRAMTTPEATVSHVLTWIWGCRQVDLPNLVRQGDLALLPVERFPRSATPLGLNEVVLRESHRLRAREILVDRGAHYATGITSVSHLRRQHATLRPRRAAIYRVLLGRRANTWGFSDPTED